MVVDDKSSDIILPDEYGDLRSTLCQDTRSIFVPLLSLKCRKVDSATVGTLSALLN